LLDPIPFGFFVAALIFDIMYSTRAMLWVKSRRLADQHRPGVRHPAPADQSRPCLVRQRTGSARGPALNFWLNVVGIVAALINAFVHSRDAYASDARRRMAVRLTVLAMVIGGSSWLVKTSLTRSTAMNKHKRGWQVRWAWRPVSVAASLCLRRERADPAQQIGANPALPKPQDFLVPPMQVPDGVGWKGDAAPKVIAGLQIEKIASGLKHPRQLLVLPNGDVLVVESNGPGEEAVTTPKQVIAGKVKANRSGKGGKGGNRVTLLRKKPAPPASGSSTSTSRSCTRPSASSWSAIPCTSRTPATS
jgi:hypothetical protein